MRFTPAHAREIHLRSRAFIEATLGAPHDGPTVVVTHHAPHPNSVHPRFVGNDASPGFVSDLSDLIARHGPELWVHGHTHDGCDYVVGGTRVVCNPKGYGPRSAGGRIENAAFDPQLVVGLEPATE